MVINCLMGVMFECPHTFCFLDRCCIVKQKIENIPVEIIHSRIDVIHGNVCVCAFAARGQGETWLP